MNVTKAEWTALNAAVSAAETLTANFKSPEGIALHGRVIAARAILTGTIPDERKPKHAYLPSRHPARNN
jgi:hypothetical protein